ncbi:hypothetical protein GCM10022254_03900 [Actinomadura meridiana]|uniref:Uncharacterized protein n=1 Tax=Actinomadura meridiana TaxID=559626 RepID=A0ABP8BS80_9ACTN
MFTAKRPCPTIARIVPLRELTHVRSSGGELDTLHSAEQVNPRGFPPSSSVVTTETPLANEPITLRNVIESTDGRAEHPVDGACRS